MRAASTRFSCQPRKAATRVRSAKANARCTRLRTKQRFGEKCLLRRLDALSRSCNPRALNAHRPHGYVLCVLLSSCCGVHIRETNRCSAHACMGEFMLLASMKVANVHVYGQI